MARSRRLARDYERLSTTLAGLHYVAFGMLMLKEAAPLFAWSSSKLVAANLCMKS